jgi:hypothetical protein
VVFASATSTWSLCPALAKSADVCADHANASVDCGAASCANPRTENTLIETTAHTAPKTRKVDCCEKNDAQERDGIKKDDRDDKERERETEKVNMADLTKKQE